MRFPWPRWRTPITVTAVAILATFLVFRGSGQGPARDQARSHGHPAAGAREASGGFLTPGGQAAPSLVAPGEFAPGACVAFAPARDTSRRTVFLDAGHGGTDPGGSGRTAGGQWVTGADVNLQIEKDTLAALIADGYRVVVSRTGTGTVRSPRPGDVPGGTMTPAALRAEIGARDACANMARADVLIGIDMNAGRGGAGPAAGYDNGRPFAASSRRLALLLQRDVLGELRSEGYRIPDGGVTPDLTPRSPASGNADAYGHLLLGPARPGYSPAPSTMPGALIEPLFLSDPPECSIAASPRGQSLIAAGIARAAGQYFAPTGGR